MHRQARSHTHTLTGAHTQTHPRTHVRAHTQTQAQTNKLTHTAIHTATQPHALVARTNTQAHAHTHPRAHTHALLGREHAAGVTAMHNVTLNGSGPVTLADRARGYPRTVTWLIDAPGPITVVFTQLDTAGSNGAYPKVP